MALQRDKHGFWNVKYCNRWHYPKSTDIAFAIDYTLQQAELLGLTH